MLDTLNGDPWAVLAPLVPDGDIQPVVAELSKALPEVIGHVLSELRDQLRRHQHPLSNSDSATYKFLVHTYLQCLMLPNAPKEAVHLHQLLPLLNQLYLEVYSACHLMVMMIVVKLLKDSPDSTREVIQDYLEVEYDQDHMDTVTYLNFIQVMTELFPLVPEIVVPIYTDKHKCQRHIDDKLATNSHDTLLITVTLELFSALCINDECRNFNLQYVPALKQAMESRVDSVRLLATVCVIKLWNFIKTKDIPVEKLAQELMVNLDRVEAIEGLAYLLLNLKVKLLVRRDEQAIDKILNAVKTDAYGALVVLANLTLVGEQTTQLRFKQAMTPGAAPDDSGEDSKVAVDRFNHALLFQHPLIATIAKVPDSSAVVDRVVTVIYNVANVFEPSQQRVVRAELVKQGALKVVVNYLGKYLKVEKLKLDTRPLEGTDVDLRLNAIRAMAKMVISTNPALAFGLIDAKLSVPFLIELLGPNISQYQGQLQSKPSGANDGYLYEKVTQVDKYDAILALTNLTLLPDKQLRVLIISRTFDDYLTHLIIDLDHPPLQRAAWELVLNLISEPAMLAKFFNLELPENEKRLQLLIKLLDASDVKLQCVIAGLLANATSEYDMITQLLVTTESVKTPLLKIISHILLNETSESDLVLRVAYVVSNLVYCAANHGVNLGDAELKQALAVTPGGEAQEVLADAARVLTQSAK